MATFKSYGTAAIGTTETAVYTPSQKSIVIGLAISNIYGSVMPITIKLYKSAGTIVNIAKARRVESGTYVDLMAGNKLVIENGDILKAFAGDAAAFDVTVSVLEGVA
jgi:hypothetical protein